MHQLHGDLRPLSFVGKGVSLPVDDKVAQFTVFAIMSVVQFEVSHVQHAWMDHVIVRNLIVITQFKETGAWHTYPLAYATGEF